MPHVTGPILACPCGTIFCTACYTQLGGAAAPCPTCTSPLGSSRNRGFERVRDKFQNQLEKEKRESAAPSRTIELPPDTVYHGTTECRSLYHGTSIDAALKIQAHGFDVALSGSNAGALLGPGVYCTTTLKKAMKYTKKKPLGGIIFELRTNLGNCKTLVAGDTMMKTWQQHGYDSAWAPLGANKQNLAENCIKDPSRVTIVRAVPGDAGELKAMGILVRPDGRLAMIGDEAAAAAGSSGAHKRKREPPAVDTKLLKLLRTWKLEDVADDLANEGVQSVKVLQEELPHAEVEKLKVGLVYKNRLRNLLTHLKAAQQERRNQEERVRQETADIRKVLERMRANPTSKQVQHDGCKALCKLAQDADKRTVIAAAGGTSVVLAAMMAHAGHANVQEQGCWALAHFACGNHDIKTAIVVAGGIPVVLVAMTAHTWHAGVQEVGCRALSNLTVSDTATAIAAAGSIRVVLSAMRAHTGVSSWFWQRGGIFTGHARVQEQGCAALTNLSVIADNRTAIAAAGGIPVVLAAMKAYSGDVSVQDYGCGALATLAVNVDNNTAIAAAGGISVVLAAMKEHIGHADVQTYGCWALANLAANTNNKTAVAASGGVSVVLASMKAHMGHKDLQAHGCKALVNLASNADNRTAIVAAGGIPVVLAVMTAHTGYARVQEYGCCALCFIGWSDTTLQKSIKDEGGVAVVQAAMAAFGATTNCKEQGQQLLHKLAQV